MELQDIEKLYNLKKEHPNHKVVFMVDSQVLQDDFGYGKAMFGSFEVGQLFYYDDVFYTDFDSVEELIADKFDCDQYQSEVDKVIASAENVIMIFVD